MGYGELFKKAFEQTPEADISELKGRLSRGESNMWIVTKDGEYKLFFITTTCINTYNEKILHIDYVVGNEFKLITEHLESFILTLIKSNFLALSCDCRKGLSRILATHYNFQQTGIENGKYIMKRYLNGKQATKHDNN